MKKNLKAPSSCDALPALRRAREVFIAAVSTSYIPTKDQEGLRTDPYCHLPSNMTVSPQKVLFNQPVQLWKQATVANNIWVWKVQGGQSPAGDNATRQPRLIDPPRWDHHPQRTEVVSKHHKDMVRMVNQGRLGLGVITRARWRDVNIKGHCKLVQKELHMVEEDKWEPKSWSSVSWTCEARVLAIMGFHLSIEVREMNISYYRLVQYSMLQYGLTCYCFSTLLFPL